MMNNTIRHHLYFQDFKESFYGKNKNVELKHQSNVF